MSWFAEMTWNDPTGEKTRNIYLFTPLRVEITLSHSEHLTDKHSHVAKRIGVARKEAKGGSEFNREIQ